MAAKRLVVFAFCLLIKVGIIKAEILSFRSNKDAFRQGEQIELTCELSKPLPFGTTFHIDKHYGNQTKRFDEEENSVSSRFNLSLEDAPNYGRVKLTIKNAVPGDSGNYSCVLFQNHNTTSRLQLVTVEDEPDSIKLFLDDKEIANGSSEVRLKPNGVHRLRCESGGSNPRANISMTYGDMRLTLTNVTNSSAIFQYNHIGDYPFVIPIEYNTTATVSRWVFTADAFSQPVVCSAKVNSDAPGISTLFYPDFEEGAPVFVCNDSTYAMPGQRDFLISCVVYSKPTLNKASFFFNTGKANQSINGYPWGTERWTADKNYRGIVQVLNDQKFLMNLTISVTDAVSRIKFNFEAGNDRGANIHAVELLAKGMPSLASSLESVTKTLLASMAFVFAFLCRC